MRKTKESAMNSKALTMRVCYGIIRILPQYELISGTTPSKEGLLKGENIIPLAKCEVRGRSDLVEVFD